MTTNSGDQMRPEYRRRVLIGAYAAGSGDEPEAGAGWALAVAAARDNDVWLITRPRFKEAIEADLASDPRLSEHLTVVYHDLPPRVVALKRRSFDLYWYYVLWQHTLARVARRLHRTVGFDVVHHATWANDWLPAGVTGVRGVPFVWGPVGGASAVPLWKLRRWLGARGFLYEVSRKLLTGLPRWWWGGRNASRAAVVVAQNRDVARQFAHARFVVVEPNAALAPHSTLVAELPADTRSTTSDFRTAVFAGRLIGWKGARLAIETLASPSASSWRMDIYGDGYDRAALEALVRRHGLDERVEFLGHRPRAEVLAAFATADAMLFPSMHDQAGWVAGEASSLGCPVVCLPLAGPPTMAHTNAFVASLDGDVVANLAAELARAGEVGGQPHDRWSIARLPELLDGWYAQALGAARKGADH